MDRAASKAREYMDKAEQEFGDRTDDDSQQQMKDDHQHAGGGMKEAFDHLKEAARDAREAMQQRNQ
ncbi:MAG: hypothetical protein J2P15_07400 [Micromonosporaceae bacterium]|nr:hypothetical protein [Micromonosporaceae bacterium]